MATGVQFTGTLAAHQTATWYTFNWPATEYVLWSVIPDTISTAGSEVTWSVATQRTSTTAITYWITITNQTAASVAIEARYVIAS